MTIIRSKDIYSLCEKSDIKDVMIAYEKELSGKTEEEILSQMELSFKIMEESTKYSLENKTSGKIIGGETKKLYSYINNNDTLSDKSTLRAIMYGFSVMEKNVSMGKIVACPTAGSCGVLPGVLVMLKEKFDYSDEEILRAMFMASAIGIIIGKNASLSGAEGGCQAEIGSASAMASAAAVVLKNGTLKQAFDAAAICLKNLMGLVCDPVAGLVESPCLKRNAIGISNALISADIALAGIESIIPFDEVVKAMNSVGKSMPCALRETAEGGIAISKTGIKISEKIKAL
ncbi:MAG: L-serine ammonia-lyase, iron-sulfur-dependent, subunit alpha [Clostridia bacterium]|jgi:L-serine dehydratase|nr:L-serine ammonia-lyase, iron-sulfur-dependent, subunit alpha [Clostridia bacterium]